MEDSSYKDKMTLDEIAEDHENQVKDTIRNAKRYNFGDAHQAMIFVGMTLRRVAEHLGLKNPKDIQKVSEIFAKVAYSIMVGLYDDQLYELGHNVKIEWRQRRALALDLWRCGMYVYKDDVLAAFISDPFKEMNTPRFFVVTNAKLDDTKKFYVVPVSNNN